MPFFCDTSVLFAASDRAHQHHAQSLARVSAAQRGDAFCAAQSLAELYATLTATPQPKMRRTEDVLAGVEQAALTFTTVSLSVAEYLWVLRHVAGRGARSGQVYDALILKCAEKCGADIVYTWNTAHFLRIAWPEMLPLIRTP
ncbi:MAG: type II toxin-antitoxin system VapC family toxin [Gemmatimonadaceae bacterium]